MGKQMDGQTDRCQTKGDQKSSLDFSSGELKKSVGDQSHKLYVFRKNFDNQKFNRYM